MLKKRIIAVLPVKDNLLVQSIGFQKYLPIGQPKIAIDFLNQWGIDEIIILDIDASARGRSIDVKMISETAKKSFVPITAGGGIRSTEDMQILISSGADKISINTSALNDPNLISRGADMFGQQCIIVSIDVCKDSEGRYEIYSRNRISFEDKDPIEFAVKAAKLGAGEIFVNMVDQDGMKRGYDLNVATEIGSAVDIPVIVCGGVGHPHHFVEALQVPQISAAAAGNFFHFIEHSAIIAKSFLVKTETCALRLDTYANYLESDFSEDGRLCRKDDSCLNKLFFEFHPKEVI